MPIPMNPIPTDLALDPAGALLVTWSDGQRRVYEVAELRRACPCATCNSERSRADEIGDELPELAADLAIAGMKPVGNYAYNIRFSDGHDTGIYPLDALRSLGRKLEDR